MMGSSKLLFCVLAGLSLLLGLSGCTVGPNYEPPEIAVPPQWSQPVESPAQLQAWWRTLDDPVLWELIERADAGNPNLRAALARIEESRAFRRFTAGEDAVFVDGTGSYSRNRPSENGSLSVQGLDPQETELYAGGFGASWEIDVFGRVRRSVEYAQALLESSIEDFHGVQVSLYAEVARNYVDLRTIQEEIQYALENIEIQQKTLELTENRFKAELVPELDVLQARQNLANTIAEVPSLRIAERAAVNRLAVLLGTYPGDLQGELFGLGNIPVLREGPGTVVPAELLRQRPDIRSAERLLAAQTARIGIATAQLYPAFSLTGAFELQGMDFSDLGNWASRAYSYGPGFRWNLLNGGQIRSLIDIEEAATVQSLAVYEATVLGAVEEVENALTGYVQETARREALEESVEAAKKSVEMAETLYRSGLTDFQTVLDSQRVLFVSQDRLAVSRGAILQQAIGIYRALGGGWQSEPAETAATEISQKTSDTAERQDQAL